MDISKLSDAELDRLIEMKENNDPLLALVGKESSWKKDAKSGKGAFGYTQFMDATRKEVEKELGRPLDMTNLVDATDAARHYLTKQYKRFGSWDKALAAYNAGPGAVSKHGGIPPFAETQDYVKSLAPGFKDFKGWDDDDNVKGLDMSGMQSEDAQAPQPTSNVESMSDAELNAKIAELEKKEPAPLPLNAKPNPDNKTWEQYYASLENAQKGRWWDVAAATGGSVAGAVVGGPVAGPAGIFGGGMAGNVAGTLYGNWLNIQAAQKAGEVDPNIPNDVLLRYLLDQAAWTVGFDIGMAGMGRVFGPALRAAAQKVGTKVTESEVAKAVNDFMEAYAPMSDLKAAIGRSAPRAAHVYRKMVDDIAKEATESLDKHTNKLMHITDADGFTNQVQQAKTELAARFEKHYADVAPGSFGGETRIIPGSTALTDPKDGALTMMEKILADHKRLVDKGSRLLAPDEEKVIKNLTDKIKSGKMMTVGDLRDYKKGIQAITEFSKEGAINSPTFVDKVGKGVVGKLDDAIVEALEAGGKKNLALEYKAANAGYTEAMVFLRTGAAKAMAKASPIEYIKHAINSGTTQSVREARDVAGLLVKQGQITPEVAQHMNDEIVRQWTIKYLGGNNATSKADALYQSIVKDAVGVFDPATKEYVDEVFKEVPKQTKKIFMDHLEVMHNLARLEKELPEQMGLGPGLAGFWAIASGAAGGAVGGGFGGAVGAASGQMAIWQLFTKGPELAAKAAISKNAAVVNKMNFFQRWMKNFSENLLKQSKTGDISRHALVNAVNATPGVRDVVRDLLQFEQENRDMPANGLPVWKGARQENGVENLPVWRGTK